MYFKIFAALFALTQAGVLSAAAACNGADPAIMSVANKGANSDGKINTYQISGIVTNRGSQKQASNVLQFVDISENGIRLDAKSIPPLNPGQSFTFTFAYQRSVDAGAGTSNLVFQLDVHQPSPPGAANCDTSNDRATLTI